MILRRATVLFLSLAGLLAAGEVAAGAVDVDPALAPWLSGAVRKTEPRVGLLTPGLGFGVGPTATDAEGLPGTLEVFLTFARKQIDHKEDTLIHLGRGPGGEIYAARLSPGRLRALLADESLKRVRLSRPLRAALDESARLLGLNGIRRIDSVTGTVTGRIGRGVIVGIVDTGVDFHHPDFKDAAGRTRFHTYWDQTARGAPPRGFGFGAEHTRAGIDNSGRLSGRDFAGHGTHVMGIAAGNGRASLADSVGPYLGVAPGATLVCVRTFFTEFAVAVGVRYIFDQAERLGLPAVVNLSLGSDFGPHRGTTPFETSLESMVAPGHLIVTAAGNAAHGERHAELRPAAGDTAILGLRFPNYARDSEDINFVNLEGWFDRRNRYRIAVLDPRGAAVATLEWGDEDVFADGAKGTVRGWHREDLERGTLFVSLEAHPAAPGVFAASGRWMLRIEALEVGPDPGLDFWVTNWNVDGTERPRFTDFVDPRETVGVPGTAAGLITVGAAETRNCWPTAAGDRCYKETFISNDAAFFSGIGPTSDGRPKPDLYAPGYGVVSCMAATITSENFTPEELALLEVPGEPYMVLRGTSMAAPQVAGTVALLLERFPKMTKEEALARLRDRGSPSEDARIGEPIRLLQSAAAVAPLTRVLLAELRPEPDGIRVRWSVSKERGTARYDVYRGFSDAGPFHRLAPTRIMGSNPFEILDRNPESGREHVYRVAVTGADGLEEDLDTLRIAVPGFPRFVLRAPDPNPARETVHVRYFLAPTRTGGTYRVEVFDVRGRRIRRVAAGAFSPEGREGVSEWDLRDDGGRRVGAGMYWIRLRTRGGEGGGSALVARVVVLP